ncbi:MAG: molybdopterin-binding protein [Planctomycetota bacterium]
MSSPELDSVIPVRRASVIVLCEPARHITHGDVTRSAVNAWLANVGIQPSAGVTLDFNSDDLIRAFSFARDGADLVVVCGGTGIGPQDIAPQTLATLCDFDIPGIGELLRAESIKFSLNSHLSRCGGYVSKGCLVLSIPGNSRAAIEQLDILKKLLLHTIDSVQGRCKSRRRTDEQ